MSKHTPGPWIVIEEKYYSKEAAITSQDRIYNSKGPICELDYIFNGSHGDEQIANMALICAAPDLLEALEAVIGWSNGANPAGYGGLPDKLIDQVVSAIERARGEA